MIVAILQARTSSSRMPGKILTPLLGQPMLLRQIERVRRAGRLDRLVVATSQDSSDDAVEQLCVGAGAVCFRGSLEDVLDRFYRSAKAHGAQHVVRLTGDCPLADPRVIDETVAFFLAGGFDYASNCLPPTFPDGLDVEVFRFSALEAAWKEASLLSEREHVTPFIHGQPARFRIGCLKNGQDLSFLRWTVDELADFQLVAEVYKALYPKNPTFGMEDVLDLLKRRPELLSINKGIARNEGYLKSRRSDAPSVTFPR